MAAPATTSDVFRGSRCRVITIGQSGANNGNLDYEMSKPLISLTMQLTGTYVAGTVAIQGSNDGTNFVALPTAQSLSALGVKSVAVADLGFKHYRFAFTSMDAGNTLVLYVVAKHFF